MAMALCARVSRRMFSTVPQSGAQISRLSNGVTVVSHDHGEPVSTVSIYAAAGSRNETPQTAGAALYLTSLPYLSSKNRTNVYIARDAEANGFKLLSCVGRENIGYHVHFLRQQLGTAVDSLVDVVSAPAFYDWEVRDYASTVSEDVEKAHGDPHSLLLQDAHRGLFRNTFGPSLYNKNHEEHTPESLSAYYNQHFVGERIAVVGTGVPHAELLQAVQGLAKLPPKGSGATKPAKYFGGAEILVESPTNQVHAAFVFPGASVAQADAAAVGVVQFLLGGVGSSVKYSDGSASSKVAAAVASSQPGCFSLTTVHSQYSDAGLLAVLLTTSPSAAGAQITAAAGAVRAVLQGFTDADIKRAKNQLIFSILSQERGSYVSGAATEALATHKHTSSASKVAAVESVSASDVKAVAGRLLATQPVYVARGSIDNVPYLDQLFK